MSTNHLPCAQPRGATIADTSEPRDPHVLAELVVDLDAIAHNVRTLARRVSPSKVMVVVKADAYNHGLLDVATTALQAGAHQLAVATIQEALTLRALGIDAPVTAWMWFPGEDVAGAFEQSITLGIPSLEHAHVVVNWLDTLSETASSAMPVGGVAKVTLMADTGLSRSGVEQEHWAEVVDLVATASERGHLEVTGVMSHLASADNAAETTVTDVQRQRFEQAIEVCRRRGLEVPINHLANTPAALSRPDTFFEMVRPGVGIYGVDPVDPSTGADLRPAMTLRARVITTRTVRAGKGVSYNHTWRAAEDTRTAVVAIGYADGVPRSVSGRMEVSINGHRFPQIGRVCMDQIVVSLGAADDMKGPGAGVRPGDWAVLFGEGGPDMEEFARWANTISYEVQTMPRGRVVRTSRPVRSAIAHDADEMREIGRQLGRQLVKGTVVVLTGPLGAGKTTLTQGIAEGLGVRSRVQSPTFTIVRTHKPGSPEGPGMLHMDAYRLLGEEVADSIEPGRHVDRTVVLDALESLDLDADVSDDVLVAEWGRGVVETLSDKVIDVSLERADDSETRLVSWRWLGQSGERRAPHFPQG